MTFLSRFSASSRYPAEFLLLLSLAFFLPLYEAPKNLLWVGYVLVWVVNRSRHDDWGGRWNGWDSLILLWVASGYVVALFAGVHGKEWKGANDLLRYGSIFWCLRRSGYTAREMRLLGAMFIASCLIGLGWGAWRYYITHTRHFLELHSVGHVNHSAPYIAICLGLAVSALTFAWGKLTVTARAGFVAAVLLIVFSLLATASRAAIGAALVIPMVVAVGIWHRSRLPALILAVLVGALALGAVAVNADVVKKQRTALDSGDVTNARITIWRRAVVAFEAYPVFGVGMDNFGGVTDELVQQQVEAKGQVFHREDYYGANHAHNLYLNTLAERGLFGSAVFLAILVAWVVGLWRQRPRLATSATLATLWGASASAWGITVVAGIGNTSFHDEISLLAVMLWGAWMSLSRTADADQSPRS